MMKAFFFRLETLLKVRHANVTRLQREYAYLLQKLREWKEKEKTLIQQIEGLMEEIRQQRTEKKRHLEETYRQILDHLNHSLANVQQVMTVQEKQLLNFQERLSGAIQARKVIEKIREKHYTQWKVQQLRVDDAEEIARPPSSHS